MIGKYNILSKRLQRDIIIEWNTQMSQYKPISIETLTEKQLDRELKKGYADMLKGHVQSAEVVFA